MVKLSFVIRLTKSQVNLHRMADEVGACRRTVDEVKLNPHRIVDAVLTFFVPHCRVGAGRC